MFSLSYVSELRSILEGWYGGELTLTSIYGIRCAKYDAYYMDARCDAYFVFYYWELANTTVVTKSVYVVWVCSDFKDEINICYQLACFLFIKLCFFRCRKYNNGSVLRMHVDTVETHVVSAIINVDQGVEEDWPLLILGLCDLCAVHAVYDSFVWCPMSVLFVWHKIIIVSCDP